MGWCVDDKLWRAAGGSVQAETLTLVGYGGESGNLVIHNNTIARFSGWKRTYNPAIGFSGVGNNYTFNNMYNGPHTGVQGEGNNHMFANNNFTDMCYEGGWGG